MPKQLIAKTYDELAEQYTKESYEKHLAISSLKQFLSYLPNNSNILDVGCGGGQDSKFLAKNGCSVLGIDISKEMIRLAKKLAPEGKYMVADLSELVAKEFDGIWCCRVFHHISIKEQRVFLRKLNSLLKPNAVLYISCVVSEKNIDYEAFDSGNNNLLKKRLTPKSFKDMLVANNFKVKQFKFWGGKKGMEIFAIKN